MTLTEAAVLARKAKFYIGIPVVLLFLGWMIYGMLTVGEDLPENYITPDYMCGQLDELEVKSPGISISNGTKLSIETTSGAIPDLPKVVNVFKYTHQPSLTALAEAKSLAENLDFEPENYTRKSTSEYEWKDLTQAKTLIVDTSSMNFKLETDFANPGVDTHSGSLPSEENAKEIATQFLQTQNLLTQDYLDGYQKTYFVKISADGSFTQAKSLSDADLVRVDFFRNQYLITINPELTNTEEVGSTVSEELNKEETSILDTGDNTEEVKKYSTKIYNDSPIFGNISVYLGGLKKESTKDYQVFKINYVNWVTGSIACGTYGLISPQEAVRKVQDGKATLVYLNKDTDDKIIPPQSKSVTSMTILEVGIGYLDKEERQMYMQPVFFISGEAEFDDGTFGDFYYYVPAVDYESIPDDAGTPKPTTEEST